MGNDGEEGDRRSTGWATVREVGPDQNSMAFNDTFGKFRHVWTLEQAQPCVSSIACF